MNYSFNTKSLPV